MTRWHPAFPFVFAGFCVVVTAMVGAMHPRTNKHTPLAETEAALAYACGHVAGQRAIMRLTPALYPSPGTEEAGCARWSVIAKHKGFGE